MTIEMAFTPIGNQKIFMKLLNKTPDCEVKTLIGQKPLNIQPMRCSLKVSK